MKGGGMCVLALKMAMLVLHQIYGSRLAEWKGRHYVCRYVFAGVEDGHAFVALSTSYYGV